MFIRGAQKEFKSDAEITETLSLDDEVVKAYNLEGWASRFSLMTAGYRDHIDPDDAANPAVPFNAVTVALMSAAKGRVLSRKLASGATADVHVGGEVRTHTQTFIQIAARVYAAQGFRVHLRQDVRTSPIWYSSFGVFFEEYQSGDNFTASHSPFFKLGWKVLDSEGKELTEEEEEIIEEIRGMVRERSSIHLAPWRSKDGILEDLNVDAPYARYQRAVLGSEMLSTITDAASAGFRCSVSPLGGSMGTTPKRIFQQLGIPDTAYSFFLDAEDPRFHRVGEIGEHNLGADVGKSEVCARTGAPEKLLSGEANIVLLWDPDGDRLNVMSTMPIAFRSKALENGLKLGADNGSRIVVFLTPNQLYMLLIWYRVNALRRQGRLDKYDWLVVTTFPSAMAIEELASKEGIPTLRVPVGFRNLGDICRTIEKGLGQNQTVTTLTGRQIKLGPSPRALLLCEESGGASLGSTEMLESRNGKQRILSLREKDGLQVGLLAWSMAASLHRAGVSIAEQYCRILDERQIRYRYGARVDASLYNETLTGAQLQAAKSEGIQNRDRIVEFFRSIATAFAGGQRSESEIRALLRKANPAAGERAISTIKEAAWIGDGSLFEMEDSRLIIRASGTDALIRYYVEATSADHLKDLREFGSGIKI